MIIQDGQTHRSAPTQCQIIFDKLTYEEESIWLAIKDRRGEESAIIGDKIAEMTGVDYDRIRAVIRHLNIRHDLLIMSCGRGYFVPANPEEFRQATRRERHRAISILYKISRQQKTSVTEVFGQGVMEFQDECEDTLTPTLSP